MPFTNGPRQFGGAWPAISHMFDGDQNAWLTPDPRTGLVPDRPPLKMMKSHPTSEAITRMEAAISWPGRYLGPFPQLTTAVANVAFARLRYRDLEYVSEKLMHLPVWIIRKWNRDGLDQIASGLRHDRIAIF
jgi:hypothetical protein